MNRPLILSLRSLFSFLILIALIGLIYFWYATRERLPEAIRIAAGRPGSLYHTFAHAYSARYMQMTGKKAAVIETGGPLENARLLAEGKADLALFSHGAGIMEGVGIIAPLYDEMVHILVRKDSGIGKLTDLDGKALVIGTEASGGRSAALRILQH